MDSQSPTGAIELDTSQFPLVELVFQGDVTNEDVFWLIDGFEMLLNGRERYAIVVREVNGLRGLGPAQRRILAEWQRRRTNAVRDMNVCAAVVLRSAVARGIFTAYQWIAKPPSPSEVFGTYDEALAYATGMLARESAA